MQPTLALTSLWGLDCPKCVILLPWVSKCRHYRHEPLHLARIYFCADLEDGMSKRKVSVEVISLTDSSWLSSQSSLCMCPCINVLSSPATRQGHPNDCQHLQIQPQFIFILFYFYSHFILKAYSSTFKHMAHHLAMHAKEQRRVSKYSDSLKESEVLFTRPSVGECRDKQTMWWAWIPWFSALRDFSPHTCGGERTRSTKQPLVISLLKLSRVRRRIFA